MSSKILTVYWKEDNQVNRTKIFFSIQLLKDGRYFICIYKLSLFHFHFCDK